MSVRDEMGVVAFKTFAFVLGRVKGEENTPLAANEIVPVVFFQTHNKNKKNNSFTLVK